MKLDYRQDNSSKLMNRARVRFKDEMDRLRRLGFIEFCCYTELMPKYTALTHLAVFLMAKINRELIGFESPLRLAMSQPLLVHRAHGTYALVFGMGVKFYTMFTDKTGLITTNFPSQPIQNMILKVYKITASGSIEDAWRAHLDETGKYLQDGKSVDEIIRFENYVSISQREENLIDGIS